MKIPHLYRQRQAGLTILMSLFLIVLLVIFIGTIFVVISKAIDKLPSRPLPQEEEDRLVQQIISEELTAIESAHPNESVRLAAPPTTAYQFRPTLTPPPIRYSVERSTNLIHWDLLQVLEAGEVFTDTNPPPFQGFYRTTLLP